MTARHPSSIGQHPGRMRLGGRQLGSGPIVHSLIVGHRLCKIAINVLGFTLGLATDNVADREDFGLALGGARDANYVCGERLRVPCIAYDPEEITGNMRRERLS